MPTYNVLLLKFIDCAIVRLINGSTCFYSTAESIGFIALWKHKHGKKYLSGQL